MVRKYHTLQYHTIRPALLVVVLVAPILRADIVVRAKDRDMRSAPDPIVQELLDKFVVAQIAGDEGLEEACRVILKIGRIAVKDQAELVRQLVWYDSKSTDVSTGMVLVQVLYYTRIPRTAMVAAVAPLLNCGDNKIERSARAVAEIIEGGINQGDCVNFTYYRNYAEGCQRTGKEIEIGLVKRMYSVDPGQALLTYLDVYEQEIHQQRPIRLGEKAVSDYFWKRRYGFLGPNEVDPQAVEQLKLLSERSEWWARLYVAYIYRDHPELRSEEAVQRLREDGHPLVKEAMAAIDGKRADITGSQ
jgi:hypothetical protein